MFNKNQILLLMISLIVLVLSGVLFWQGLYPEFVNLRKNQSLSKENNTQSQATPAASENNIINSDFPETGKVLRVIDGDTIEVQYNSGETKKIRYIGINTPETVDPRRQVQCFGKEASSENKRLLEGKVVYLEKDISETDKFGRDLRYVYIKIDGQENYLFINDYLVRQGYAQASTFPPDVKFTDQFMKAEREAKENNRGLWSACKSK